MRFFIASFFSFFTFLSFYFSITYSAFATPIKTTPVQVDQKAQWQPGMEGMRSLKEQCAADPAHIQKCVTDYMQQSKASPDAIAFSSHADQVGFMRDFREAGKVDIAYFYGLFRANENQIWYLVNGTPNLINVDDLYKISLNALVKNATYKKLIKKYPQATLFPGDRSGTQKPLVNMNYKKEQIILVDYQLNNQCHACAKLADVTFGFHFNRLGKLISVDFENIILNQNKSK